MKSSMFGAVCVTSFCLLSAPAGAAAVVLDMEGIAPDRQITDEISSTRTINGFNLFTDAGHFIDSAWRNAGTTRAGNGTDYYGNDSLGNLTLTQAGGNPFSIHSFDATDVFTDSEFIPNLIFEVNGTLVGGGTVSASFTTDADHSFETFIFDASWARLTSVSFVGNTHGAYDNIVVSSSAVPVPAAVWLFGSGLIGIGAVARRRAQPAINMDWTLNQ